MGHIATKSYPVGSNAALEFGAEAIPTYEGHQFAGWSEAKEATAQDTVVYRDSKGNELGKDTTATVDKEYTTKSAMSFPDIEVGEDETLWWVIGSYNNYRDEAYRIKAGDKNHSALYNDVYWNGKIDPQPTNGSTVTLFAYIVGAQTYNVSYDANGGRWEGGAPAPAEVNEAETYNVKFDKVPTLKGYDFVGWSRTITEKVGNETVSKTLNMYDQEHYNALS